MSKVIHTHTHTHTSYSIDIPIFTKLYSFYKDLFAALKLFPQKDRYTLGQKLETITLEVFELISRVQLYPKEQKIDILIQMSSKIDLLKVLLRLSNENKVLNTKIYLLLQEQLQEIGKMAGGWLKYFKSS